MERDYLARAWFCRHHKRRNAVTDESVAAIFAALDRAEETNAALSEVQPSDDEG